MRLRDLFRRLLRFFRRKQLKLGLYGPPNGGKTTLANRICADWLGEEMGATSRIAHETRKLYAKERVAITAEGGKTLTFSLVDTPGIATRIDYEDFVKEGMDPKEAKQRAKEAAAGVVESIGWLERADCVVVVLDATKEPYNQVNTMLIEALEKRGVPFFIVANKVDLKKASVERITTAFPQYEVLGISAREGDNIEKFYGKLFELTAKVA